MVIAVDILSSDVLSWPLSSAETNFAQQPDVFPWMHTNIGLPEPVEIRSCEICPFVVCGVSSKEPLFWKRFPNLKEKKQKYHDIIIIIIRKYKWTDKIIKKIKRQ